MFLICSFTKSSLKTAGATPRGELVGNNPPSPRRGHFSKSSNIVEKNLGFMGGWCHQPLSNFCLNQFCLWRVFFRKGGEIFHFSAYYVDSYYNCITLLSSRKFIFCDFKNFQVLLDFPYFYINWNIFCLHLQHPINLNFLWLIIT